MNLSLYTSSTGMEAQQTMLNTISNNLANSNTTGFKRAKVEFQDMLYQSQRDAGSETGSGNNLPVGIEVGNGTQVVSTGRIFTQGTVKQTGEQFDIALDGNGFLEVELPDGSTGYTRDGGLKVGSDGTILTSNGDPLLSNFQAVPDGAEAVSISPDGNVTIRTDEGSTTFQIRIARFTNPSGLRSVGSNIYRETEASGQAETGVPGQDGFARVLQGHLETSNVNVVEEMVNMITTQRAYEINSKAIQTSDQMLSTIAQLKR